MIFKNIRDKCVTLVKKLADIQVLSSQYNFMLIFRKYYGPSIGLKCYTSTTVFKQLS